MMTAGFNNSSQSAATLIKPDFYIKNVLGSYFDKEEMETPILKDHDFYRTVNAKPKRSLKNLIGQH